MPTQEQLIAYLREGIRHGASHQQLVEQLLEHGWAMADINAAFNIVYRPTTPAASPVVPAQPAAPAPTPAPVVALKEEKPVVVAPAPVTPKPEPVAPVVAPAPISSFPKPITPLGAMTTMLEPEPSAPPVKSEPVTPAPVAPPTRPFEASVSVPSAVFPQTTAARDTTLPSAPTVQPFVKATAPYTPGPTQMKPHKAMNLPVLIIGVVVLLLLVGGVTYAFVNKIGPFASIPYTEDNLFSGLLAKSADMRSSTYSITGELVVEDREEGAEPFTLQVSNEGEQREKYQNDAERGQSISRLLMGLQNDADGIYPKTLDAAAAAVRAQGGYYSTGFSTTDPVTGQPYGYQVTENGQNFALTVTFETSNAPTTIRRAYNFTEEGTTIDGRTVTFTKDSSTYMYLPKEPPQPFIVSLGEALRMLPAEIRAGFGITAASEWQEEKADWTFNVDAEGDFGDLTYKVNADARKLGDIYYFRINNLPSLFGSYASYKGQWIKIDPAVATTTSTMRYNSFSSLASQFSETEEEYKKARAEWAEFAKKIVQFADEEKLARFIEEPHSEKVNGRLLYRYDFETRKEAILPFYEKVVEEASKNPSTAYSRLVNDPGIIEYLKSEEFSQVYDYFNANMTQTLWVDPKGYPARLEYSLRIVPPDTAEQLKDKQVRITWALDLSDINESVEIEEPEDARPVEEIVEETNTNRYGNSPSGSAAMTQSHLRSMMVHAEIAYDNSNNKYGAVAFPVGSCKQTPNTLFADATIAESIKDAAGGDLASATCVATASAYAVSAPIANLPGYSWCVDSTGESKQISAKLTGTACP